MNAGALTATAAIVSSLFVAFGHSANAGVRLIGLTEQNVLLRFASERPSEVSRVEATGVSGTLLGIDVRPADGLLYGVTDHCRRVHPQPPQRPRDPTL